MMIIFFGSLGKFKDRSARSLAHEKFLKAHPGKCWSDGQLKLPEYNSVSKTNASCNNKALEPDNHVRSRNRLGTTANHIIRFDALQSPSTAAPAVSATLRPAYTSIFLIIHGLPTMDCLLMRMLDTSTTITKGRRYHGWGAFQEIALVGPCICLADRGCANEAPPQGPRAQL
jgi:hypothetical protein